VTLDTSFLDEERRLCEKVQEDENKKELTLRTNKEKE